MDALLIYLLLSGSYVKPFKWIEMKHDVDDPEACGSTLLAFSQGVPPIAVTLLCHTREWYLKVWENHWQWKVMESFQYITTFSQRKIQYI